MKPVRFDAEAEEDLFQAAVWYHDQRPSLGLDFLGEVSAAQKRIQARPSAHGRVPGVPSHIPARRARLRRFPYHLVFLELEHEIRILAVAHAKRRPGYWKKQTL